MCGAPPPHPSDAQETVQFSIFFLYACVVIPFISFIPCALVCIAICCSALYCMCICICKALIMKRDIESAKRENTTRVACTHTNPTLIIFFFLVFLLAPERANTWMDFTFKFLFLLLLLLLLASYSFTFIDFFSSSSCSQRPVSIFSWTTFFLFFIFF